jgi:hypothetical protein
VEHRARVVPLGSMTPLTRTQFILPAIAAVAGLSVSSSLHAAEIPPAMMQYVERPEHIQAVMDHARAFIAKDPACRAETARTTAIAIFKPVTFGPDGAPTSGMWKETVRVQGCSRSGIYNVATGVDASGGVHVFAMLPGTSIADSQLERDAVDQALIEARTKAPPNCTVNVVDTAFESYASAANPGVEPGREARTWHEKWTVQGCAASIIVAMTFVPHTNGTAIEAAL